MEEGKQKVGDDGDWMGRFLEEEEGGREDFLEDGGAGAGAEEGVGIGVVVGVDDRAEE